MAVSVTRPSGLRDRVEGNRRIHTRDLVFSSNYATGGEALLPRTVGLKKIEHVRFDGPAMSTDLATGNLCAYDYTTAKVIQYESGASGAAIAEKTNSEAYATGSHVRAEFIGYGGI